MKHLKRIVALAMALVLCVGGLSGCGKKQPTPSYQPGSTIDVNKITDLCHFAAGIKEDTVIATVNGLDIPFDLFLFNLVCCCDDFISYYSYIGASDDIWTLKLGDETFTQYAVRDALDKACLFTLLVDNATKQGMTLTEENHAAIAESLQNISTMCEKWGITAQQYLRAAAQTETLFTASCECNYLYEALAQTLYGNDTPESILGYLESDAGLYQARHILLSSKDPLTNDPLSEAEVAKKQALADQLLAQIRASSDPNATFQLLMEQYNEDPGSTSLPNGYTASPGQMFSEWEEAALDLEEYEISDVVTTDVGFHIIQRLPLDVDPEDYRNDYLTLRMSEQATLWLKEADVSTTAAYDTLDAQAIYQAISAYREALSTVINAAQTPGDSSNPDASSPDASSPDASSPDASSPDASSPDASSSANK